MVLKLRRLFIFRFNQLYMQSPKNKKSKILASFICINKRQWASSTRKYLTNFYPERNYFFFFLPPSLLLSVSVCLSVSLSLSLSLSFSFSLFLSLSLSLSHTHTHTCARIFLGNRAGLKSMRSLKP